MRCSGEAFSISGIERSTRRWWGSRDESSGADGSIGIEKEPAATAAAYGGGTMSRLRCHISISLDGFVAGPNQSEENPLGEGGERLHDWVVPLAAWREAHDKQGGEVNESARIVEELRANIGASVMGRNMFGPIGGGGGGGGEGAGGGGAGP